MRVAHSSSATAPARLRKITEPLKRYPPPAEKNDTIAEEYERKMYRHFRKDLQAHLRHGWPGSAMLLEKPADCC
jgi:hypothetical protein